MTPALGLIFLDGEPKKIEEVRELSAREYQDYKEASGRLMSWLNEAQPANAARDAYLEYKNLVEGYLEKHRKRKPINGVILKRDINRTLSNFLHAVRAFLDQSKRHLVDRYGKDSPQVKDFEATVHKEYDDSFSYRLLDQLRNYTQHVGEAIENVSINSEAVNPETREVKDYLRVELNRDRLLAWPKLKAAVREELKGMPPKLPMGPHVDKVMRSVDNIRTIVIAQEVFELQRNAKYVMDLVAPLREEYGTPVVYHSDLANIEVGESGSYNMNIEWIPVDLATFILNPPQELSEKTS